MGAIPIMFLPEPRSIFNIELTCYIKIFPYFYQGLGVLAVAVEGTQFVLYLKHDYRSTILGEKWSDDFRQFFEENLDLIFVKIIVLPNIHFLYAEESSRQSSKIPLRTDIRARSQHNLHIQFLSQLQEMCKIFLRRLKIKDSLLYLMIVPHNINTDGIEAHPLDHGDAVLPVFRDDSGVVNLSGVEGQVAVDVALDLVYLGEELLALDVAVENEGEEAEEEQGDEP